MLIALAARRLEQARRHEAEREPAGGDGPRLAAGEVLDVAQDAIGVRVPHPGSDALDPIGHLMGDPRGTVLALLLQLLGDGAQVARLLIDLLAGLRRALVDLLADAVASLPLGLRELLARLLLDLLRLLLGLLLDAVAAAGSGGGGAGICRSGHRHSLSIVAS